MAKALQCPACGTKKRLDSLADGASFQCENCGQVLKVPPSVHDRPSPRPPAASAPAPTRAPASSGGAQPPAPRRRSRPTMTAGGVAAGAGGTAVLSSAPPTVAPAGSSPPPIVTPRRGTNADGGSGRGVDAGSRSRRDSLPLALRVLAWLVALPLGLAIVGLPARKAGYLSSQKLLDVIVKSDLSRFLPIVVIILLWALVSALLVTLFVEGGRRLMLRRSRNAAASDRAAPGAAVPARAGRA